jgi:hypothetical protein
LIQHAFSIGDRLKHIAPKVFHFEHGAGFAGSPSGCGLDLAHLHTVPLNFDLVQILLATSDDIHWVAVESGDDPWERVSADEYIVAMDENQRAIVGHPRKPVSQYVRRVIAREVGRPLVWDYRTEAHVENVRATLKALAVHD